MAVYVVQKPDERQNILSATDYGELVFILEDNKSNMMFSPKPTSSKIMNKLKYFNDKDYLLLIGDPAAIGISVYYALHFNRGKANLLKWDNREHRYYNIEVSI